MKKYYVEDLEKEAIECFNTVKKELLEIMGLEDEPSEFMGNDGEWHIIDENSNPVGKFYSLVDENEPLPF